MSVRTIFALAFGTLAVAASWRLPSGMALPAAWVCCVGVVGCLCLGRR